MTRSCFMLFHQGAVQERNDMSNVVWHQRQAKRSWNKSGLKWFEFPNGGVKYDKNKKISKQPSDTAQKRPERNRKAMSSIRPHQLKHLSSCSSACCVSGATLGARQWSWGSFPVSPRQVWPSEPSRIKAISWVASCHYAPRRGHMRILAGCLTFY